MTKKRRSRNWLLMLLGVMLLVGVMIVSIFDKPFYEWSLNRQHEIAVRQYEIQCPDNRSTDVLKGLPDECGRELFGGPSWEYIVVRKTITPLASLAGVALLAISIIRMARLRRSIKNNTLG